MTDKRSLPATFEEALAAGYRRYEALPETLRDAIRAHDAAYKAHMTFTDDACGPGHSGPCSTTTYPGGVTKVCYCNAAHQCDECVFQTPGEA